MALYKLTSAVAATICEYVLTQTTPIADGAEGTAALQTFLNTLLVYNLTDGSPPKPLSDTPLDSANPTVTSPFVGGDVIRAIVSDPDLIRCFDIIERAIDAANGGLNTSLDDNVPAVQLVPDIP